MSVAGEGAEVSKQTRNVYQNDTDSAARKPAPSLDLLHSEQWGQLHHAADVDHDHHPSRQESAQLVQHAPDLPPDPGALPQGIFYKLRVFLFLSFLFLFIYFY